MMKQYLLMSLLLFSTVFLVSCLSRASTLTVSQPSQTATLTLAATLEPTQASETIEDLLQKPIDCEAPCFWGIIPGQTTFAQARDIFDHIGLKLQRTNTENDKSFHAATYVLGNGLSIGPILTTENGVVQNIRVVIVPESQSGLTRRWNAYSPNTLISRYGQPSRVDIAVIFGGNQNLYTMEIYFDELDFIVEYESYDVAAGPMICPLIDQMIDIRLWFGASPEHPPRPGVPLDEATFLTIDQFSALMVGDPLLACLNINVLTFP